MPRETKIVLKVTEEIKNDLQDRAKRYGMTMSALGAYVIGQWLENQVTAREQIMKTIAEQGKAMGAKSLDQLMTREMFQDMIRVIAEESIKNQPPNE